MCYWTKFCFCRSSVLFIKEEYHYCDHCLQLSLLTRSGTSKDYNHQGIAQVAQFIQNVRVTTDIAQTKWMYKCERVSI